MLPLSVEYVLVPARPDRDEPMNPWTYFHDIFNLHLSSHRQDAVHIRGCTEAARALAASVLADGGRKPMIFLLPNNESADRFNQEFQWYLEKSGSKVMPVFFPDLEVNPYKGMSPHPQILEQRCYTLWRLLEGGVAVVITTPASLLDRLPRPEEFISLLVDLHISGEISLTRLRERLQQAGYTLEDPVTETGEFAIRGGVLDVFSPNHEHPLRVEFFGDFVDSIRTFDPDSQRSIDTLDSATVIPLTLYPFCWEKFEELMPALEEKFQGEVFDASLSAFRDHLAAGLFPQGGQFLLPLIDAFQGTLLEYMDGCPTVVSLDVELKSNVRDLFHEQTIKYTSTLEAGVPCLPPEAHFISSNDLDNSLEGCPVISVGDFVEDAVEVIRIPTGPITSFLGNFTGLIRHLKTSREHVLFIMSSHGRCRRIHYICEEYDIRHVWLENFQWSHLEFGSERQIIITQGPVAKGYRLPEISLAVFGSDDVFPRTRQRRRRPATSPYGSVSAFISSLKDVKQGDFVVHLEHGIGIFHGLQKLQAGGIEQEFVALEYAQGAKLFVPAERMDLIQKFSGAEGIHPTLDKLGGATWGKTRSRVKKALRDMTGELLKISARRSTSAGFQFPPDDQWQREFESIFEYEETPDQLIAVSEIKQSMELPRPMDRLLCGDVGYGKTEVAMRTAFKAVNAGKQVAILTPTTVLAFQHFHTFTNRFVSFPIRIDLLSRFRTPRQQKETIRDLASGRVDIVIGTHRLLSKDVEFHDLGLLVVDEEQRFGVTHKEKIKKIRADVDVLTMTATPIPRTLYMSITGIRDISVIETPPKDRLSIQTEVVRFNEDVILEAVRKELARNGQVYFVHNRVENIHEMSAYLCRLVPEARIAVAHGQMRESELEKIILDFMQYRYDVLLSTTIIENGIDIPLVNTIIINHAQRFGLAQLYQLRGRVGRSSRRAFAWLLVPSLDSLKDLARKRLAAIRDFTELGAGFRLAALDLEIRGAGNILGAEQHGHINAVGFETYCRLLDETVLELKGEKVIPAEKIKINLLIRLRIPESYIPQESQRLHLYKSIASTSDEEELTRLREEIKDRYGQFPGVVDHLFEYAGLRLLAQELKILSVDRNQDTFKIRFTEDSLIDPETLVQRIQTDDSCSFSPDGVLAARLSFSSTSEMFHNLKKVLLELGSHDRI